MLNLDNVDWKRLDIKEKMFMLKRLQELNKKSEVSEVDYSLYRDDPVRFGEEIFGETYTDDVKKMMESVRDNQITIAKSANATGKSLPVNTPVLTPEGYKKISSIRIGDYVIGKNGKPTMVIGVYPQGLQPTYRISFNDNTDILCSEDHLWTSISSSQKNKKGKWKTYSTIELKKILHRHMHIPMIDPVDFKDKHLNINPYLLGFLIGDGTLGQAVRFDTIDNEIVKKIKTLIPNELSVIHYRKTHYGITTKPGKQNVLIKYLKQYDLYGKKSIDKHIPNDYLYASIDQRKQLLYGLMDSDGYIDRNSHCSYSTSSKKLANDFQQLIWSFGGTAKIKERITHYTHNGVKKKGLLSYNISIKISFCPFLLKRKSARWRNPETMQKQAQRIIKSIKYIGEYDSVCIKVNAEDSLFVADKCIVTHNTHSAARVAAWWYKAYSGQFEQNAFCQVYTAAAPPEDNLKRLLWGEIGSLIDKYPDVFKGDDSKSLHIQRTPLEFITGVRIPSSGTEAQREAKFSGKHAPYLLFILDEGDAIPDSVYRGIESCMSGGTKVRLLIMFNPRSPMGEVYRMERDNRANVVHLSAFNHPNVVTGKDVIPGAVTCDTTVGRINKWCRPLKDGEVKQDDCFELPLFLEDVSATREDGSQYEPLKPGNYKIVDPAFAYMVLGQYPPQGTNQLIHSEWIYAAVSRWKAYVSQNGEKPPEKVMPVMGQDVAEMGDDENISIFRYGNYVSRILDTHRWKGVDTYKTGEKAIELYQLMNAYCCYVDATGLGSGVAPHMVKHSCTAAGIKVANSPTKTSEFGDFRKLRDQLWWMVREWLKNEPFAMLPPDEILIEELKIVTYQVINGKVVIMPKETMKEMLNRSPDRADALCLTFSDDIAATPAKPKYQRTKQKPGKKGWT